MPGSELKVEVLGSGPPLVMVPGWAMHRRVWGPFAVCLARGFEVILPELPGHGGSRPWRPWTLEATLSALEAVVAQEAVWLGWSLGGQLVMALARRRPELVRGLVVIAANPRFIADGDWPGMPEAVFQDFQEQVRRQPQVALRRFLGLVARGTSKAVGRQLQTLWRSAPAPDVTTLLEGLTLLMELDEREALTDISCPVTVIAGEDDALVPAAVVLRLAAVLPGARLDTVAAGGHVPFLAQPERIAARIRTSWA